MLASTAKRVLERLKERRLFAYFHPYFCIEHTRKTEGGQVGKQGAKINISVSSFCLSPPRPFPCRCLALRSTSSERREGGRLIFCTQPFAAKAACPGGDSRLADCAKSSSPSPPSFLRRPPQSSQSPIIPHPQGQPRFIHSLCVTNKETAGVDRVAARTATKRGLSGGRVRRVADRRWQNENTCVKQPRNLPAPPV